MRGEGRRNHAGALLAGITGQAIVLFARFMTAVRAIWARDVEPVPVQRIYFANHTSNGDFILLWSVLPPACASGRGPSRRSTTG
jgi:hypothetical protein